MSSGSSSASSSPSRFYQERQELEKELEKEEQETKSAEPPSAVTAFEGKLTRSYKEIRRGSSIFKKEREGDDERRKSMLKGREQKE